VLKNFLFRLSKLELRTTVDAYKNTVVSSEAIVKWLQWSQYDMVWIWSLIALGIVVGATVSVINKNVQYI